MLEPWTSQLWEEAANRHPFDWALEEVEVFGLAEQLQGECFYEQYAAELESSRNQAL